MNKTIISIDKSRFYLGDEKNAHQAWMDDSSWSEVSLPHDWSVHLPFDKTASSGTGYLPGGIGWYRIHITPNKEWEGKRIAIAFDGVYKNSRVWCNSYYLGERPNGYISFQYDITEQFSFDRENIISVFVDRRELADSRWFTGCGIYRKVSLIVEDAVHPTYNGIFFRTPEISSDNATYQVDNEIINTLAVDTKVSVTNELVAHCGEVVASSKTDAVIPSGCTMSLTTTGHVESPTLWSTGNPYLYTLRTRISYESPQGNMVSHVADETPVGIRSFSFDADKGFFLNGVPTLFKGVCVHHDAGCLGAAVYKTVWERRLKKLKDMGCNAIRMSHNPHMPELYALCDEMGFLVMDEAFDEWEGPKNKWSTGHNVYPPKHEGYYVDFPTWHEADLTDLIRRDRNHASVIMFSIGNEIDYPNDPYCHPSFETMTGNNDANKPMAERMYNAYKPDATRLSYLSRMLCDIVKKCDTTHPVTLAAAFPELSAKIGFIDPLDVVGFNYKEHLYEEHHRAFPDKPFLGSENGHGYKQWRAVTDNEYISGQFLWTGIDYLGEAHGWPIRGSKAGILTTAGLEKLGYYRRQSFWSDKPMIHLATIRLEDFSIPNKTRHMAHLGEEGAYHEFSPAITGWNYLEGEEILVKCYTNLPSVSFYRNGQHVGDATRDYDKDCIFFTTTFEKGELTAKGTTQDGTEISHTLYTTGCACQMTTDIYDETADILQITVTMLDGDAHRVYSDASMVYVEMESGELIGIDNGDLGDISDYSFSHRRTLEGQLVIYAKRGSHSGVKMRISAEGVKPETVIVS